jgi:hypothetical protein
MKVSSKLYHEAGRDRIEATVVNPKSAQGVAFAIHVQAVRTSDGERILPAVMNDDYFTLMPGESKHLNISFDDALLGGGTYKLQVTPYNK